MTDYVFAPPPPATLAVDGSGALYPVRRIFCIGRNFADHAAEMGSTVTKDAPFFFTKSPASLAPPGLVPYPPGTRELHHEVELVVALGPEGTVWGHAVGLDMTRRDLQARAKAAALPWDVGKDFEGAAIVGALSQGEVAPSARITLSIGGRVVQDGRLDRMVRKVPAILAHIGRLYGLGAGDLVMTGTPAGVGPVRPGDRLEARIDGLPPLDCEIGPPRGGT